MLLSKYAIEWLFNIPTNVSALPGKHELRKLGLSVLLYTVSVLACYIFNQC